jgi:hypothetical protein
MNGLRYIGILSVVILAGASGWNNLQHVYQYGLGVVLIVIGAELFKVLALPMAAQNWADDRPWQCVAAVIVWLGVFVFSLVNTFGNTLTRRAELVEHIKAEQAEASRPLAVIMRDITSYASTDCTPQTEQRKSKKTNQETGKRQIVWEIVNKPLPSDCVKIAALRDELALAEKQQTEKALNTNDRLNRYAKGDAVADGLITLSGIFQVYVSSPMKTIPVYIVLLWTLMAEVGSALGALAIPAKRGKP